MSEPLPVIDAPAADGRAVSRSLALAGEARALTDMQSRFVVAFTGDPGAIGNAAESARRAGFSERSAREIGRQLLDKSHIRDAIHQANQQQISGSLATKAVGLLEKVLDDEAAPLKIRLEAAKTVLDRAGYGALPPAAPKRLSDKSLAEMSAEELRDTLRHARAEMDKAAQSAVVINQIPSAAEPLPPLADTAGES